MKLGGGIALGLLLALIAQFLALMLAGAGHGWVTPFFASYALWILLPLTFATVRPFRSYPTGAGRKLLALALLGLVADASLLFATAQEGSEYFWSALDQAPPLPLLWILIWLSWQPVVALALARGEESPEKSS